LKSQENLKSNSKVILYIDMDGVICDFYKAKIEALERNPDNKFPQCEYGFFTNLEPIRGAKNAVKWLMSSKKFEVYVLTAPSLPNPLCYTEKRMWIQNHFGMELVNNMIISPHKHLNKGDILIDDNLSGCGQDMFEGELIHFGSKRFPNWEEVLIYLNNHGQ
jgi:5'-nucleotidase